MSVPGVYVWIPLEGTPDVIPDFERDEDALRFSVWLDRKPELAELLARLVDLATHERRAA